MFHGDHVNIIHNNDSPPNSLFAPKQWTMGQIKGKGERDLGFMYKLELRT